MSRACFPRGVAPATNDLVAWYKLDETSGTTIADSTANGNNGTSVRDASLMTVAGKFGTGLQFNGTTDLIDFGNISLPVGDITLSFWIYSSFPVYNPVFAKTKSTAPRKANPVIFGFEGGSYQSKYPYFSRGNGDTATDITSSRAVKVNTWTFCLATAQGSNLSIYVDGILSASGTQVAPVVSGSGNFYIGFAAGYNTYFAGKLDDLRIYSRALDPYEIATQYQRGRA